MIHKLLVDVYSLFVPRPYYFGCAAAVLDLLVKDEKNLVHFKNRSMLIRGFVVSHKKEHSGVSGIVVYKELESTLLNLNTL